MSYSRHIWPAWRRVVVDGKPLLIPLQSLSNLEFPFVLAYSRRSGRVHALAVGSPREDYNITFLGKDLTHGGYCSFVRCVGKSSLKQPSRRCRGRGFDDPKQVLQDIPQLYVCMLLHIHECIGTVGSNTFCKFCTECPKTHL